MNTYSFILKILLITQFLICALGLNYVVHAQEYLTGIKTNAQIINEAQKQQERFCKSKSENIPLTLPFFEDFSNYTGYPNENYFIDKQAFVNNTFPVFPPTIGVATFDALNENGEIYPHLNSSSKGADTLTSRYIRMDSLFLADTIREITPADSIYFSFYFQPGGSGVADGDAGGRIGNQPNVNDSLVLEFGYTRFLNDTAYTVWNHIWSTPGFSTTIWTTENPCQYFKQILIPVTDKNYLCDNFQFRFRNYASLEPQQGISGWEGNVDQWHIDYIRLDVNRNCNDIYSDDLAFVSPTTSFLKAYQAMPWKQFQPTDMKSNFTNQLTNLSDTRRTASYEYRITQNGSLLDSKSSGSRNIDPYFDGNGIQKDPTQASPSISFKPGILKDTTTFIITHIFKNADIVDNFPQNDTCIFKQKFFNYYAYDDGTAEYGYCLNNTYNIAQLAMKYSLNVSDSLSGVLMWFNRTKNAENEEATFSIIVWGDKNGEPGNILYTLENNYPEFAEHFLDFVEYKFDKKIPLPKGVFWIGFAQHGNVQLNIGFDQNNDSREYFKYRTGQFWETSAYKGTPMMRPVFGDVKKSTPKDTPNQNTTVGPNPATNTLQITNYELQITSIEVFDIYGRKLSSHHINVSSSDHLINISHLQAGIYFVKITTEAGAQTFKLIKN